MRNRAFRPNVSGLETRTSLSDVAGTAILAPAAGVTAGVTVYVTPPAPYPPLAPYGGNNGNFNLVPIRIPIIDVT